MFDSCALDNQPQKASMVGCGILLDSQWATVHVWISMDIYIYSMDVCSGGLENRMLGVLV